MSRARVLQEVRIMKFEEIYERWTESRLTQAQTAEILGVCERQFRRQCRRYDEDGIEGLIDKRLGEVSGRRAQFAQAMERLRIQMIAAYSPQARGRADAKRRGVPGSPPYMPIVSATPTEPPAAGMGHFFALARAPLRLFASMRR